MHILRVIAATFLANLLLEATAWLHAAERPRPNIVVILSDDMGFSDVGCYGSEIETPLIVHWPRGIRQPGRLERTPGHLIDIMATAVDLAGASYPADKTPLEGKSLAPLFAGGSIDREAIYWEHEGNRAVREGDWKLVAAHGRPWELYDLSKDRPEQNDLSGVEAQRAQRMAAMWDAYAARTNVEPWEKVMPPKKQKKKPAD